ncbi:MAG: hypothetical protein ABW061_22610 [Polyangiaceae bacterium]
MRTSLAWSIVLGMTATLGGCSKSAPAPGKAVALDQVCNEADGGHVRLTGYVRYRRGLLSFCSTFGGHKTCDLELSASAEAPPDFDILHPAKGPEPVSARLSVPVGDHPGEMDDLPEKFKTSDIKVHLPNGAVAGDGSKITIDGVLSVIPSDPKAPAAPKACFVTLEWAAAG